MDDIHPLYLVGGSNISDWHWNWSEDPDPVIQQLITGKEPSTEHDKYKAAQK